MKPYTAATWFAIGLIVGIGYVDEESLRLGMAATAGTIVFIIWATTASCMDEHARAIRNEYTERLIEAFQSGRKAGAKEAKEESHG